MGKPYTVKEKKAIKEEYLDVLEKNHGMVSITAKRVGITRDTILAWRKQDKRFNEACEEIQNRNKEMVESVLMKKILDEENLGAVCFYLKTKGGWSSRMQLEVDAKANIDVAAALAEIKNDLCKDDE